MEFARTQVQDTDHGRWTENEDAMFPPRHLQTLMDFRGYTPPILARQTHLARQTITRALKGQIKPSHQSLTRIADALRVDSYDLDDQVPPPRNGWEQWEWYDVKRTQELLEELGNT